MKNDHGAAFPLILERGAESDVWEGMSLRDYFAGQALVGITFNLKEHIKDETYAQWAYKLADAMLAEREQK
jgi:hypothetical protein